MKNNTQQGFTLIELVIVIVILGILATTAAPKFISFTSDANVSALAGVKGGITSAMGITNAKAAIDGKEIAAKQTIAGVEMLYGFPTASVAGIITAAGISAADDLTSDYVYFIVAAATTADAVEIVLAPVGKVPTLSTTVLKTDLTTGGCYISYTEGLATTVASVTTYTPASAVSVSTSC
jgi:MSHA pilin protein MshA